MNSTKRWAARSALVALSATAVISLSGGTASAAGSTCTPGGQRPGGPVTLALRPLIGDAGYNNGLLPLGNAPFAVTGALDAVVCQLLP